MRSRKLDPDSLSEWTTRQQEALLSLPWPTLLQDGVFEKISGFLELMRKK